MNSLIGRFEPGGAWFVIGSKRDETRVPPNAHALWLGVLDNKWADNSGSFRVTVTAKGSVTAEIIASPQSKEWLSPGHAFICIGHRVGIGIKEECYGFYSSNSPDQVFIGAPALSNEFRKNPERFQTISWSLKKVISDDQRRAFYALVDRVNTGSYRLLWNNCGDFVSDAVNALGWQNVAKGALPEPYVRALYVANIKRFVHSAGRFDRTSNSSWREYHNAITAVYEFRHIGHDDTWLNVRDDSRNVNLRLPLKGGHCQVQTTGSWSNLYVVSPQF